MKNKQRTTHDKLLTDILNAKSATDLQKVFSTTLSIKWHDETRSTHLLGLCVGRLFEYNPRKAKEILNDWINITSNTEDKIENRAKKINSILS